MSNPQPRCGVTLEDFDPQVAAAIWRDPSPDALRMGIDELADLLTSLVQRPNDVTLVITFDLKQAVERRDNSGPYTIERGSGAVAGKTMSRPDGGIDVIIDGIPLIDHDLNGIRRSASGGLRLSPDGVELRRPTVAHEAQHANMRLNGSGSDSYGLKATWTGPTRLQFIVATKMCDEHRAQWNTAQVIGSSLPTTDDVLDVLCHMGGKLSATAVGLQSSQDPNARGQLAADVYRACSPFWTGVAFWTAEYRQANGIGQLPNAITNLGIWQRYVGQTWQSMAGALSQLPVALATPSGELHEAAVRVAAAVGESLRYIGFRHDVSPTAGEIFDVTRSHFPSTRQ
jgi:hypothetical protein